MFEFLKNLTEKEVVPQISDPIELAKKTKELEELVKMAASDGIITAIENAQITQLATLVGINKKGVKEMIKVELLPHFKKQIDLMASDGEIDEEEMIALSQRAEELGITEVELSIMINEILAPYKKEAREKMKNVMTVAGISLGVVGAVLGAVLLETASQGNIKFSTIMHI